MSKVKINFLVIFVLASMVFASSIILAEQVDPNVDSNIPDSWYHAPKTASDLGMKEFNQSPMLDDLTKAGELPPVAKRLPEDPIVIEPYEQIGKYGGTAVTWDTNLGGMDKVYWNTGNSAALRYTPTGETVPNIIKDWEYSDDFKKITLHLRRGLKWSDGHPFTAQDYLFWWKHIANNEELEPVPPEDWSPSLLNVTAEDNYTVTYHYDKMAKGKSDSLAYPDGLSPEVHPSIPPAHYVKQFHPDFIGEEKADQMAKEYNFDSWVQLWERFVERSSYQPEYDYVRPGLGPYVAVSRSETTLTLERNPYYPFVDTEGNQLPYIDRVRINLASNSELAALKAVTGESDLEARHTRLTDMPLYKKQEEVGNYTARIFSTLTGSEVVVWGNLTHENPKLRAIFQDSRFRKALSLSMNREEINKKIYYGEAVPRQYTFYPGHEVYKESYGEAYADYNLERARELLDEMGMVDRNGDGYREMPKGIMNTMGGQEVNFEGEDFNPTFTYCDFRLLAPILEILQNNWQDVGLNINLKMVSRELFIKRNGGNQSDMSGWPGTGGVVDDQISNFQTLVPVNAEAYTPWPKWVNWYKTDGESGEEPPAEIKELINAAETAVYSKDNEERKNAKMKILEAQAENLWTIGTVGLGPHPVLANNRVKNMAKKGYWEFRYLQPYHSDQFYLEE